MTEAQGTLDLCYTRDVMYTVIHSSTWTEWNRAPAGPSSVATPASSRRMSQEESGLPGVTADKKTTDMED